MVGYSIRGESVQSKDTRLLFCTIGVLLKMVQNDPLLANCSHVIVDEVHERGMDSDFLLILLKDLIKIRNDLKIILMSATIDADMFSNYFNNCKVIKIQGFTFPVENIYLEDILKLVNYNPSSRKITHKNDEDYGEDERKVNIIENAKSYSIEYGLISALVNYISCNRIPGGILIFVPGLSHLTVGVIEIMRTIDSIKQDLPLSILNSIKLIPLHSNLSITEQQEVFKSTNLRKVVVSTNIAETSVTIDDIVFIIDTGRVKEMKLFNNVLSLVETWASQAACKQRRGRAGRVRDGFCYKLFSRKFESKNMALSTIPEILRLPLEQICLEIKILGIEDVHLMLSKAISPPPISAIDKAVEILVSVRAIDKNGQLTALGYII